MISILTGKIVDKQVGSVVVSCGGVGFEVFATPKACDMCTIGETATLFTYLAVKEDSMTLFGFSSTEEKLMFQNLISISGIGPKMALSILEGTESEQLALAIVSGNVGFLSKIKGVGKKTAERIVLELKEKLSEQVELHGKESLPQQSKQANKLWPEAEDAVFGLRSLGIRENEAVRVVESVAERGMSAEEIITKALKGLAK